MVLAIRFCAVMLFLASVANGASEGTISGTVRDPAGAPFKGAFVRVRDDKRRISYSVLSDKSGHFQARNIPAGEYTVRATALGFDSELRNSVNVTVGRDVSADFALKKKEISWSDLTVYQGRTLLPDGKGKDVLFAQCVSCHGFQTRMAGHRLSRQGWTQSVAYMRQVMKYILAAVVTDQEAADISEYLYTVFGAGSTLPKSPAELPGFPDVLQKFSDGAMKIEWVDFDLPAPNRFPWNAAPDRDGKVWIPDYGKANRVGRLDPATGEIQEFASPYTGTA
jgi:hypothetical protein